jgi:hypothetical protein
MSSDSRCERGRREKKEEKNGVCWDSRLFEKHLVAAEAERKRKKRRERTKTSIINERKKKNDYVVFCFLMYKEQITSLYASNPLYAHSEIYFVA